MMRTNFSERRFLAIGLSLALTLSFAACGDDDSAEEPAAEEPAAEEPAAEEPAAEEPAAEEPAAEEPAAEEPAAEEPAAEEPAAEEPAAEPAELTTVVVGVPNTACFTYVPMYVAMAKGYYEAEGLEIQVEGVDGSSAVIQALAAGNADFGIPSSVLVMGAIERGEDMTTFYNVKPGGSHSVITQADSGITSAADLEGKVIGVATADGSEVAFAKAVTDSAGLVEGEDFEFLVVGDGGPAVAGFTRGDIDAYASAYSDTAVITQAGLEVVDITPDSVRAYFFGNGITALASTLDEHPEWAEGLARGFAAGSVYTWENPEEVIDICSEISPQEMEDREFALALLAAFEQPFAPLGDDPWGYFDPTSWETLMQVAIDSGSLEGPVDLDVAFTNRFVESTQP